MHHLIHFNIDTCHFRHHQALQSDFQPPYFPPPFHHSTQSPPQQQNHGIGKFPQTNCFCISISFNCLNAMFLFFLLSQQQINSRIFGRWSVWPTIVISASCTIASLQSINWTTSNTRSTGHPSDASWSRTTRTCCESLIYELLQSIYCGTWLCDCACVLVLFRKSVNSSISHTPTINNKFCYMLNISAPIEKALEYFAILKVR